MKIFEPSLRTRSPDLEGGISLTTRSGVILSLKNSSQPSPTIKKTKVWVLKSIASGTHSWVYSAPLLIPVALFLRGSGTRFCR